MSEIVGYARGSTGDQDLSLQLNAIRKEGCVEELIFTDKVSGAKSERPGLDKCLNYLKKGDILLVWRLDRLGRSMSHLVKLFEDLRQRGIRFRSICDGVIDTTSASGELVFNIFSALAQFERRLIQERTKAGLSAARARGRLGGRKRISCNDPRVKLAHRLHEDKTVSIDEICKTINVSRATLYRYLKL